MSTHNIRFYGEISRINPKLSSNTLICSTVSLSGVQTGGDTMVRDSDYKSAPLLTTATALKFRFYLFLCRTFKAKEANTYLAVPNKFMYS